MHVLLIGTLCAAAGFSAGVIFSSVVRVFIDREVATVRGRVAELEQTMSKL